MKDSIDVRINDYRLPIEVDKDSDYVNRVLEVLNRYSDFVANFMSRQRHKCPDLENVFAQVYDNNDLIRNALQSYFSGSPAYAYSLIKHYIKKYTSSPFFAASIDDNYAFRGLAPTQLNPDIYRASLSDEYKDMRNIELFFFKARLSDNVLCRKDMLHIPFDMRGVVDNQRFSIAGIPCMYLSTTSWGCWIETGRPDDRQFQVSSFKLPGNLRILNLCISQEFINGSGNFIEIPSAAGYDRIKYKEYRTLTECIELFPLVIASSFRVKEAGRKFKSEYILPQMIMLVCCELGIDGVAYTSKRAADNIAYPKAVNIALIMKTDTSGERYWCRSSEVHLTEPVRFSEFLLLPEGSRKYAAKKTYINKMLEQYFQERPYSDITLAQQEIKYNDTIFSAFDEYLARQTFASAF